MSAPRRASSCGQAVWALAASAGVAALLVASEPAFVGAKLAGAAYLVYLGVRALLAAVRGRSRRTPASPARTSGDELRQGVLSNLGNPKMAVFFSSLLPQFARLASRCFLAPRPALLRAHARLAGRVRRAVARAGDVLRRPRVRRTIDAVTGTALVAFGLRLAASRSLKPHID